MVVSGTLFGDPHAWNMVELDGKKYFIDATYNAAFVDPNAMFMVSYDKISQTHYANASYLPYIK
jgi:transglutaminase/protease-like cytokinesis protein 3